MINPDEAKARLINLYAQTFGHKPSRAEQLPISGSARMYFRLQHETHAVIGAYNADITENLAFLTFSKHFTKSGLNVPEIFAVDSQNETYLQEDLGDTTLFSALENARTDSEFPESMIPIYKKVLSQLIEIQTKGGVGLDYSVAYPRAAFDDRSVMWDLNYFKYHFLKLAGIAFNEELLENDFQKFTDLLMQADHDFFLFRDFQSRNIMLKNEEIYFIDYQGGRKGALQYDLASLLFDAKAEIPNYLKTELKDFYISELEKSGINTADFNKFYPAYALVRVMQAMGAYGYRGFFERKTHFLESIPPAIENLKFLLSESDFLQEMPHLKSVLEQICESKYLLEIAKPEKLKVSIKSFSYKRGLPYDASGNGGGFVFDCRYMLNPGRIEQYKKLCGKDLPVIEFLKAHGEADIFLDNVFKMIKPVIEKYQNRKFKNLSIGFGCTGGQHRSVFSAEETAEYIRQNFDVNIELTHTQGW